MHRQVLGHVLHTERQDEVAILSIIVFDVDKHIVSLRDWVIGQKLRGVIYSYIIYSTLHWSKEVVIQMWYLN